MMILTSFIAAVAMALQSPQNVQETLVPLDMMSASIEGPESASVDGQIAFKVRVRDMDVKAYYNAQTEAVRTQVVYTDAQRILADPKLRGGKYSSSVNLIRQDQMTVSRVGWDANKQWFEYCIVVKLDKEQQVAGRYYILGIEIQDTATFDWLRDKSQFLGRGFATK
jgi:hypothetical protein